MDTSRLLRSAVALVAVGLLAGALGMVLILALDRAGLAQQSAYAIGAGTAVAVTLAVADTFTIIGSGPKDRLSTQPREKLAIDFLLAGLAAAGTGGVLTVAGLVDVAGGLLVIGIGVAIGYGTFVARNVDSYRLQDRGRPGRTG